MDQMKQKLIANNVMEHVDVDKEEDEKQEEGEEDE